MPDKRASSTANQSPLCWSLTNQKTGHRQSLILLCAVMALDQIDYISGPKTLIDTDKADLLFGFNLEGISAAINP